MTTTQTPPSSSDGESPSPFATGVYRPGGATTEHDLRSDVTPQEAVAFCQLGSDEQRAVIARAKQEEAGLDSSALSSYVVRLGAAIVGLLGISGAAAEVVRQASPPSQEDLQPAVDAVESATEALGTGTDEEEALAAMERAGEMLQDQLSTGFGWDLVFIAAGIVLAIALLTILAIAADARRVAKLRARIEMYEHIAASPSASDDAADTPPEADSEEGSRLPKWLRRR